MRIKKRGQIALFIMIGIIILFLSAGLLFVTKEIKEALGKDDAGKIASLRENLASEEWMSVFRASGREAERKNLLKELDEGITLDDII